MTVTQPPVYTIGHSTRSLDEFVDLLRIGSVRLVVDVRTIPRSRTNPQYNLDSFPDRLEEWQIQHTIIPALGGRRSRQKAVPDELNQFWKNRSFHNYADYAMSAEFQAGLDRLLELSADNACAIMCSEAVWWRCHRRIIADYLMHRGRSVLHLMGPGRAEPAKMTPGARASGAALVYPARDGSSDAEAD